MTKTTNEGKEFINDLNKIENKRVKKAFANSAPVLIAKGIWLFAEGFAQLGAAVFMAYEGHFGHFPTWGKYLLNIAAALILVPAALLLAKFFRRVGKE